MLPDSLNQTAASSAAERGVAAQRPHPVGELAGFIDVIAGKRISGWAWDPDRPERRLDVEIRFDGKPIATVRAERLRNDLLSAGIGDGHYGYEALHTATIGEESAHRVTAVVNDDGGGDPVVLVNRVARTIRNSVLSPEDVLVIRDAIEAWPEEQRALVEQLAHRLLPIADELRRLREIVESTQTPEEAPSLADDIKAITDAQKTISDTQKAIDRRMTEIEGYHRRFDRALSELQQHHEEAEEPEESGEGGLRRMLILLGAIAGVSLLIGLAAYFFF